MPKCNKCVSSFYSGNLPFRIKDHKKKKKKKNKLLNGSGVGLLSNSILIFKHLSLLSEINKSISWYFNDSSL